MVTWQSLTATGQMVPNRLGQYKGQGNQSDPKSRSQEGPGLRSPSRPGGGGGGGESSGSLDVKYLPSGQGPRGSLRLRMDSVTSKDLRGSAPEAGSCRVPPEAVRPPNSLPPWAAGGSPQLPSAAGGRGTLRWCRPRSSQPPRGCPVPAHFITGSFSKSQGWVTGAVNTHDTILASILGPAGLPAAWQELGSPPSPFRWPEALRWWGKIWAPCGAVSVIPLLTPPLFPTPRCWWL